MILLSLWYQTGKAASSDHGGAGLSYRTHKEDIMGEKGKTVFITGGSTGIGAACVRKFAGEGWNVAFMDINA